ncbi:cytochrome bc complex cytochrome b subunit, partial [Candidatus Poribacteria bacterium]|nr:cytochrome bc complex cytochrome b subunit [Candidatus Poribacteria bacterium]
VGEMITKIMRGGEEVGAVTLTRFYAIHTIWLPWMVFALIGLHLFFVRHQGSSGLPKNTPAEMEAGKPFYPHQVFEDVVAIFVLFLILAGLALFAPIPLEDIADPTDASYAPRPEWYFLFLFQLLTYFEGPLEVVGTFVIPTLAILLLLFRPFLDKRERAPLRKRPVALTITSLSVLLIVLLTILGGLSPKLETPSTTELVEQTESPTQEENSEDTAVFDLNLEDESP